MKKIIRTIAIIIGSILLAATAGYAGYLFYDIVTSPVSHPLEGIVIGFLLIGMVMSFIPLIMLEFEALFFLLYVTSSPEKKNRFKNIINPICLCIPVFLLIWFFLMFIDIEIRLQITLLLIALYLSLRIIYLVTHFILKLRKKPVATEEI
ncbi:MAG: hypothetical protein E7525_02030 [Ruminococcaceae bacterium]|nr:hypothetical protein [Oscillospiraceae bacterium]